MTNTDDPVLVRRDVRQATLSSFGPGLHSHNRNRRETAPSGPRIAPVRLAQLFLLLIGLSGIGYYAFTLSNQNIHERYENWAFDQQISGRSAVGFADYLREKTAFGFLAGSTHAPIGSPAQPSAKLTRPVTGSLLGRVTIQRLRLAAIVREGVDAGTLSTAVGHVPSTALPGEPGNFAIAAHRDTLFRALKDIQKDDEISFESPEKKYTYQVEATKIVQPSDVSVLRPDGGGLMDTRPTPQDTGAGELLTMITCYPFYYVGSAPKRFIVEARLISEKSTADQSESHPATTVHAAAISATSVHQIAAKRTHKKHRWFRSQ